MKKLICIAVIAALAFGAGAAPVAFKGLMHYSPGSVTDTLKAKKGKTQKRMKKDSIKIQKKTKKDTAKMK